MRYNKYILWLTVFCCTVLSACNKYLDMTPKGFTLLTTVNNYDQWLNDANVLGATSSEELNLLADNVDNVSIPVPPSSTSDLVYTWAPQFSTDINAAPIFWGKYSNINKYNTVLQGIDNATGGTDQQKKSLKAEALLGRAFEYFYLVNIYGKAYDPATADKDPGVPFVISNDVKQTVPPRSTVKEIYDHIISDINTSISHLPADNSNNRLRGSVAAAYSVLARIYLYMRNYSDAAKNAQLALQHSTATMLDFNAVFPASAYTVSIRPDALYGRQLFGYETPTLTFLHSFDAGDLRLKLLYSSSDNYTGRGNTMFAPLFITSALMNTNTGTSVQEMKLIIAEAAARSGDLATALKQLNEIRIDRFPSNVYQQLQSADQATVLNWALRERALELPYSGLRWFDMRRFDKEGTMLTVNRYDAQGNIIATLLPKSLQYTLQIPVQVLQFNPGMEQNPR